MNEHILQLRSALPYIRRYRDALFVIKLGGELFDAETLDCISEQVAVLYHVGVRPVIVHGGGRQVDGLVEDRGGSVHKINGRRITDADSLDALIMVVAGKLNQALVSSLSKQGLSAVGLTGLDGSSVTASRRPPVELLDNETREKVRVDFGHVGDIQAVNTGLIRHLLDKGHTPVMACVAEGPDRAPLNVNADGFAMSLAVGLNSSKLIYLVNVPGLLRDTADPTSLISYADAADIDDLIEGGVIQGGMLPKVGACIDAVRKGVARAHIVPGSERDALLVEIFTNQGRGTMIVDRREGIDGTEL